MDMYPCVLLDEQQPSVGLEQSRIAFWQSHTLTHTHSQTHTLTEHMRKIHQHHLHLRREMLFWGGGACHPELSEGIFLFVGKSRQGFFKRELFYGRKLTYIFRDFVERGHCTSSNFPYFFDNDSWGSAQQLEWSVTSNFHDWLVFVYHKTIICNTHLMMQINYAFLCLTFV